MHDGELYYDTNEAIEFISQKRELIQILSLKY